MRTMNAMDILETFNWYTLASIPFKLFFIHKNYYRGPIRGGLNILYPCKFLTLYLVSLKFRLQISRKLKAIFHMLRVQYPCCFSL